MSDTDRNNLIATKFRELADLFAGVAQGAGPSTDAPAGDAEPKKRGRPVKADAEPAAPKSEPIDTTAVVTLDHPKRAELVAAAKAYAALTSMGDAQKAMKLFGESSKVVPDADLAGAIVHFKNLTKKATPAPAPADDDSI